MMETVERLSFPRLQPLSSELPHPPATAEWAQRRRMLATLAYGGSNEEVGKLHGRRCSAGVFVASLGQRGRDEALDRKSVV